MTYEKPYSIYIKEGKSARLYSSLFTFFLNCPKLTEMNKKCELGKKFYQN